jgi:hypothetical protein
MLLAQQTAAQNAYGSCHLICSRILEPFYRTNNNIDFIHASNILVPHRIYRTFDYYNLKSLKTANAFNF